MKVIVTGGAGFIGSHVVDGLSERGHAVEVLDNLSSGSRGNVQGGIPLHVADIRDARAVDAVFDAVQPDAVCHHAAQVSVRGAVHDPRTDAETNIGGLLNTLNAAKRVKCQLFVFASSGGVLYGDVLRPADERSPVIAKSPYAISKWAGEQYLAFYAKEHGLSAVSLRYANVYGPRQSPHGEAGVVAIFCNKLLHDKPATIYGDGTCVRDYVYVSDVARANVKVFSEWGRRIRKAAVTTINLGTGVGTDVNAMERALRAAMRRALNEYGLTKVLRLPLYGDERAGDLKSSVIDASRASGLLGWQPEVSLADGLATTAMSFVCQQASAKKSNISRLDPTWAALEDNEPCRAPTTS